MSAMKPAGVAGDGVRATWNYTLGSIVFFCVMFDALVLLSLANGYGRTQSATDLALILLIMVASAVQIRYCWFLGGRDGGHLPHISWTIALLVPAGASWLIAFFLPERSVGAVLPLWIACALLVCLVPKRWRWPLLAGGAALTLAPIVLHIVIGVSPMVLTGDYRAWMMVAYAATLPFILLTSLWWWRVVLRLDESRRVSGELAVTQERLRFAADLHDIQGHHLQVIALKSELAERLLEQDPAAAAVQLHEVRLIAKQAMEETRSLVADLREVELDAELENAREVLSLAGAECDLDLGELPDDVRVHRGLALSVREATTNILRHSDATAASISLRCAGSGCTLVVANNGLSPAPDPTVGRAPGSGLAGLRDRIEELGGTLETDVDHDADRFELHVWVPVRAEASV